KDFQACADGLLPMNIDQISRTAIGFPSGGAVLDARARQMLDVALEYIKADPQVSRIELDGHSDNVGDRLSNRELSRQRVLAVQAYLVERGVDEDMISIRFHGERYPVANNNTREGREKNRRVTLRLERSISVLRDDHDMVTSGQSHSLMRFRAIIVLQARRADGHAGIG